MGRRRAPPGPRRRSSLGYELRPTHVSGSRMVSQGLTDLGRRHKGVSCRGPASHPFHLIPGHLVHKSVHTSALWPGLPTLPVLVAARTRPGPPGSSAASRWLSSVLARARCAGPASPGPALAGPGRELTAQSLSLPPVPGDQPCQKLSLVFAGLTGQRRQHDGTDGHQHIGLAAAQNIPGHPPPGLPVRAAVFRRKPGAVPDRPWPAGLPAAMSPPRARTTTRCRLPGLPRPMPRSPGRHGSSPW